MSAPVEVTIDNYAGKYIQNKALSTEPSAALALQGVGWVTRKAISLVTVTLTVQQYKDQQGNVHIYIETQAPGGFKGTPEERILDGASHSHENAVFGSLIGHSKLCKISEIGDGVDDNLFSEEDKKFVTEGWSEDFLKGNATVMQDFTVNKKSQWVALAAWGFDVLGEGDDRKRRHVRRLVIKSTKTGERKRVLMIFDWVA